MGTYPAPAWSLILDAALADLGDALDHLGSGGSSFLSPRSVAAARGELLEAAFFGESNSFSYVSAPPRPQDRRWGELLYDIASVAFAPWGKSFGSVGADIVGLIRVCPEEAHVIVRVENLHIFQFPYSAWPSGIHMGAWESICEYLAVSSREEHVHRYVESQWVSVGGCFG